MLNCYLRLAIVVVALGSTLEAAGQQATEMFIPIGQSPGLSNKESVIGTLESVYPGKRMVTISNSSGSQTVGITDRTMIWLDRSEQKQPNQNGGINDLQKGRKIEIKVRKGEAKAVAEWIKVQVGP
ncbi:MAG TPA: hypothetical protein VGQ79_06955 [Nitrospiraceae bacterium]|jgi:hypothetical protein|nr:hypothetical protein [Nitrospiraceae bacterium]